MNKAPVRVNRPGNPERLCGVSNVGLRRGVAPKRLFRNVKHWESGPGDNVISQSNWWGREK